MSRKSAGHSGKYQKKMPVTDKNIGKNYIRGTHQRDTGTNEIARRQKQQARREEFGSRRERKLANLYGISIEELRKRSKVQEKRHSTEGIRQGEILGVRESRL